MYSPTNTNAYSPLPFDRSFGMMHHDTARCGYFRHAHNCYELIYFRLGHGYLRVGDAEDQFGRGLMVLTAPDLPHAYFTDGFLPHGQRCDIYALWFSPRLFGSNEFLPELSSLHALRQAALHGLRFSSETVRKAGPLLLNLYQLDGHVALTRILQILDLLHADEDARQLARHRPADRSREDDMLKLHQITEYTETHFADDLRLDEVAAELGFSVSTLNAILKKYLQTTFLQYLTDVRVGEAKYRLEHSSEGVTEIAYECGFNSIATFNRRFRAATQTSPTQFRDEKSEVASPRDDG